MTTAPSPGDGTDVVTLGETMALMRADQPGPLPHAASLSLGMGGAESNFAIALRRLGTSVSWIGRVGDDSLGEYIRRELAAERVDATVITDPSAPTGLMIKERRTRAHQKVWYYRAGSAGSRLCPADLPVATIERARLLHVTGITPALSPTAAAAVDHAIDVARAAGTLVALDVNYRSAMWGADEAGRAMRALATRADIVFAGEDEAALLAGPGRDPVDLAEAIGALGPHQVVIKLGADGAVALVDGTIHRVEAVPVDVVDTVGAGDGFVAGYLSDLLAGADATQRLRTAARVGAFACMVPGDWEGMPRRDELPLLDAREPVMR